MIDTHCHLLPGLDDGPPTLEEAAALARELLRQGVEHTLCTPHHSEAFPTTVEAVEAALDALRAELARLDVQLQLDAAAEVGPLRALTLDDDGLRSRSVAGRFVVVEVLPETPASFVSAALERCGEVGLAPVFAHPERCRALQRSTSTLDRARTDGALVQVLASSLTGLWGDEVARTAWRFVSTGRADLVGSDAHGLERRPPVLAAAAREIADRLGATVLEELTETAPAAMLAGSHPDSR